uniref:Uncharacterized protein n=1 Tax=Pyxicephalus adspersus TaxID=30357 RepID=A0AAV3AJQ8_PYXAD|nr:TPA: hypothetical protein GDO54_011039 [Pyxicephalus adspersus]
MQDICVLLTAFYIYHQVENKALEVLQCLHYQPVSNLLHCHETYRQAWGHGIHKIISFIKQIMILITKASLKRNFYTYRKLFTYYKSASSKIKKILNISKFIFFL